MLRWLSRQGPSRSEVQRLDLLEHLADAGAEQVPVLAEGGHLGIGAFRFGQPGARRIELSREPRVLFGHARAVPPKPLDPSNQQLELLFQTVDRFEIDRSRGK